MNITASFAITKLSLPCLCPHRVGYFVAGDYVSIIDSDSGIEHFGWYDGRSFKTPQQTNSVVFPRDVLAKSYFMPDTNGATPVGCKASRRG